MSGEQLPPVVATIEGDDASYLDMLDRDVAALRSAAAEIEGMLASLDIGAGLADSLSAGNLASLNSDEITQALSEQMGGVGGALAQDVGDELTGELANVGVVGGERLAEGLNEGFAGAGDVVAESLVADVSTGLDEVVGQAAQAGVQAGQGLADGMVSSTATVAEVIEARISEQLRTGLDEAAQATMAQLGAVFNAGLGGVTLGRLSVAGGAAAALTAQLSDVMGEAGGEAGDALMAALSAAATQAAPAASAKIGDVLAESAVPPAVAAGASAGAAFGDAFGSAALVGVDLIEQKLSTQGLSMVAPAAASIAQEVEEAVEEAISVDEALLQTGIDNFTSLADAALRGWMAEVETAAMSASDAFISTYEAIQAQLTATTEMTNEQEHALEYLYTQARAEMDALQAEATAFNASIKTLDFAPRSMTLNAPAGGYSAEEITAQLAAMNAAKAEAGGLGSDLAGVEKAASGATSSLGGMAGMMSGPWGMAAFGLMSILPMLGSVFSDSSASAADFTQAVQQDSGAVGDNTAATIQQTLAKSDLSGISQQLGLSQATLIEYAAGESQAQQQVTAAYNAKQDALEKTSQAEGHNSRAAVELGNSADQQSDALATQKAELDQVTGAVQQAIAAQQSQNQDLLAAEQTTQIYNASVNALGTGMLTQVEQTQMANDATREYAGAIGAAQSTNAYMTAAMGASIDQMQLQAQTTAYASVGLLGLGVDQSGVNNQLIAAEEAYTQAQQGASAYSTAITALSGNEGAMLDAYAQTTLAINSFTTSVAQNGTSLDVNTVKGAQNVQSITAIATAADNAAAQTFESQKATEGATVAWNHANDTLASEEQAFEGAAIKAGFNKQQVDQLAGSLFKLPANIDTSVTVNTSQATSSLDNLLSLYSLLAYAGDNAVQQEVSVEKQTISHIGHATGGQVLAGHSYTVGEQGTETFTPASDGYITPHYALGTGGTGGGDVHVHVYGSVFTQDEITDAVQTGVLRNENRNTANGLAYSGF